ncbi:hypothetical protein EYR40_009446 [Pleurotus pulmonarius]|nr:hypothetical protein EYR38_009454 [Pleurotus pulmonarius]KAF4590849.1 hypothetical protein EYR40_009446 [Pleurotus pulmonarius]
MPSFRVPSFIRPQHSFNRLRSFHLAPGSNTPIEQQLAEAQPPSQFIKQHGKPDQRLQKSTRPTIAKPLIPRGGVISLSTKTYMWLAIILSLLFIGALSCSFAGAGPEDDALKLILNDVLTTSGAGIVLTGENVDVDVDEPSVTIRWAILACGDDYTLPGSVGLHGSSCGLPAMPLDIYVDNDSEPTARYDPSQIPYNRDSGSRRSIQNLVQFDSDHVLNVEQARLYPFDTYFLSSTLRIVSPTNQTLPIRRLATIDETSSFLVKTVDIESYSNAANNTESPSRDIDMFITRPGNTRAFTLLLFGVSWILTHVTICHVIIARMLRDVKPLLKHLVSAGAILVALPQIRNSMPDAPGLDGVLIDCIGFFPQMVITSISVILLLIILAAREYDIIGQGRSSRSGGSHSLAISSRPRPPPVPGQHSTSKEISQYDLHRMIKHLKGQYVFPPVQPVSMHRLDTSRDLQHRRSKTLSKIMEAGELHTHK